MTNKERHEKIIKILDSIKGTVEELIKHKDDLLVIGKLLQELADEEKASATIPTVNVTATQEPIKQVFVDIVNKLPRKNVPQRKTDPTLCIVHHSATLSTLKGSTPEAFARYHVENHGWTSIGYHFVVMPNGTIYKTLNISDVGYHTAGQNSVAVGVCFVGDFDKETPTAAQYAAVPIIRTMLSNVKEYQPHSKYAAKSCPGKNFDMSVFGSKVSK